MSFFKKLFSSAGSPDEGTALSSNERSFGRYTEVNKTPAQLAYWTQAIDFFGKKQYVDSFNALLLYMHDKEVDNVTIRKSMDEVSFEIIQGSKIIRGKGSQQMFTAEVKIARFERLNVAFLRKLMNMNYVHQYTRFALKDDVIHLKFDSQAIDASPNKVYFSLKELALKADRLDDTLTNEFDILKPVDVGHVTEIPDKIKEVKYKYLQLWINEMLNKISNLNEDRMSGGISFIILSLLFRIDYLLQPQGKLLDDIDIINNIYNAKDNKTTMEKNRLMIDELTALLRKDKYEIMKGFYDIKATFGFVPVTTHKQFYEFILEHFKDTQWYYDNRHEDIVTNIYEWIIGYAAFYYGLYPATYDLLKIAYKVLQPEFFEEMGLSSGLANSQAKTINKNAIEREIQRVIKAHVKEYPKLAIIFPNLRYNNVNEFLYSYLNELTYLNFAK